MHPYEGEILSFSGSALKEHERQVAEFMRQAKAANPELYREVSERHTVLTDKQLAYRRAKEVPWQYLDEDGNDGDHKRRFAKGRR